MDRKGCVETTGGVCAGPLKAGGALAGETGMDTRPAFGAVGTGSSPGRRHWNMVLETAELVSSGDGTGWGRSKPTSGAAPRARVGTDRAAGPKYAGRRFGSTGVGRGTGRSRPTAAAGRSGAWARTASPPTPLASRPSARARTPIPL